MNPDTANFVSRIDLIIEEEKFDFSDRRMIEPIANFDRDDLYMEREQMINDRYLDRMLYDRDMHKRVETEFDREDFYQDPFEKYIPDDDSFIIAL